MFSPKVYQFLVGAFASLGSFLYGYDLGVIAEVIASGTFTQKFEPSKTASGLVVSLFTTGAFFGAFLAGPVGDYLGRRATLTIGSVVFLLGGGLQTGAKNLEYLHSGRFFAGIGVGFLCMIVPIYQAELAHPTIRGRIVALQQFMLGIGAFVAAWISYGTFIHLTQTSAQWRLPLGLQNIPAVLLAALIWLFPESPRWLLDNNRPEQALKTLARLHANGNMNDPFVQAEFNVIQKSIAYEHEHEAKSYIELFKSRSSFRRLFICCTLQASVQMTGVSAIQYYSPTIYGKIGISPNDTLKWQGVSSLLGVLGELCCVLFVDKLGRRRPLIVGNLFHMVTFIIATVLLAKYPPTAMGDTNKAAQWAFIVMTWLYNFAFSAGAGSLSWIIPSEVFDTRTRAKGVSLATMTSFAFNTMIGQVTPIAMQNIGYRFYYLFIVANFTNAVFFWLFLPETANRPLEDMNGIFTSSWIVIGKNKKYVSTKYDTEMRMEDNASTAPDMNGKEIYFASHEEGLSE